MIKLLGEINDNTKTIYEYFNLAQESGELNADACAVSTISKNNSPDTRFVNIKYIENNDLIFFSNYNSTKSMQINLNNNACLVFYWKKINIQIRMRGIISKTSEEFSDQHFNGRSFEKNIAAIISKQSQEIESYEKIIESYDTFLENNQNKDIERPNYWGGFKFSYDNFEIWKGSSFRLNERYLFERVDGEWLCKTLQP